MAPLHAVAAADLAAAGLDLLGRGLVAKAAGLAQRLTAEEPGLAQAWQLATETARAQGNLARAIEAAARWAALAPEEPEAAATLAALRGAPLPPRHDGLQPVPFILIDDFLPPARHAEVVDYLMENVVELVDATVMKHEGERQQDGDSRSARVGYEPEPIKGWFREGIAALLPEAFRRFEMTAFEPERYELQLTASYHGDFYRAHRDFAPEIENEIQTRRITYVYYFRPPGGDFQEGDLRLYDWRRPSGAASRQYFTTIEPRDNRLIVFPSHALHEVMPVKARSGRVEDGRFTLNGWVHCAVNAAKREAARRQLLPWGEPAPGELDSVGLDETAAPAESLDSTATSTLLALGEAREVPLVAPVCLLGDVAQTHRQAFAARRVKQGAPLVARLREIEVTGQGFLLSAGRIVESPLLRETPLTPQGRAEQLERFLFGPEVAPGGGPAAVRARPLRRLAEPVTLLAKSCCDYYGHWLLELLPMIALARQAQARQPGLPPRRWLVAEPLPAFLPALLEPFGIGPADLVTFRPFAERLLVEDLLVPSRGVVGGAPTEALEAMRRQVLAHFRLEPAVRPSRRLFLSRRETGPSNRPLTNRDAVARHLVERGFEELIPERLSWREQVAAMAEAALIVSEDGSLAHNALFAPEGTPLLFLCSPERAVAYQQAVAALRNQPLGLVVGRRREGAFRAFEVPPGWLQSGLETVEALVPPH